jgi:hypothetical protein
MAVTSSLSRPWRSPSLRIALVALLAMPFASCGGSSNSPTTPTTQPPGPSQANITVTYSNIAWQAGGVPGKTYAFAFTLTAKETAGLSAKGNFIRADFYDGGNGTGTNVERAEIGGDTLGTLAANGSESLPLLAGFNAGSAASVIMTTNFTDAKGNVLENKQTFNCCG